MSKIISAKRILDKLINFIIFVFMFIMCLVVCYQVITRFIFHDPPAWTEEVARYCMVYIAMLGSGVAIRSGGHMSLVMFTDKIKNRKIRKAIFVISCLSCAAFAVYLIIYGCVYVKLGFMKAAASIPIKMGVVYPAIPIGGVVLLSNTLENLYELLAIDKTADGMSVL